MADNTTLNAGSGGDTIATDDIGGVKYQRVKITTGADGSATDVSSANPVPVSDAGGSLTVDGTVALSGTSAISAASLPLPTGAATETSVAATATASGAAADAEATGNGSIIAILKRLRTLLSGGLPAALGANGGLKIEGVASGTVVPVSDGGGSLTVDGTVTASNTAGSVAHDGADSGNPVKVGGRARTSDITAVASDDRTDFITDALGKQITTPYASPENLLVGGTQGTPLTNTTSTQMIAAQAAGVRIYVTSLTVTNGHASVGTVVQIRDGSGGTVLWECYCAPAGGGASPTLTTPLRGSAATALHAVCVTTGASITVSVSGYKAAL